MPGRVEVRFRYFRQVVEERSVPLDCIGMEGGAVFFGPALLKEILHFL